jgi:hypothetical protein
MSGMSDRVESLPLDVLSNIKLNTVKWSRMLASGQDILDVRMQNWRDVLT